MGRQLFFLIALSLVAAPSTASPNTIGTCVDHSVKVGGSWEDINEALEVVLSEVQALRAVSEDEPSTRGVEIYLGYDRFDAFSECTSGLESVTNTTLEMNSGMTAPENGTTIVNGIPLLWPPYFSVALVATESKDYILILLSPASNHDFRGMISAALQNGCGRDPNWPEGFCAPPTE